MEKTGYINDFEGESMKKEHENISIQQSIIPEFSSGSSMHAVTQQQESKTLKQVEGLTNKNTHGFTLIELLVVVLIIGILAAIALPQYQKAVERARTADALAYINALEKAIELVVLQNGGIPNGDLLGGTGINGSLSSDIKLDKGLTCQSTGGDRWCYNKDWRYLAWCWQDRTTCHWAVWRDNLPASSGDPIAEVGGDFDGQSWYRYCYYESDKGEQICNMLDFSLKFDDMSEGF